MFSRRLIARIVLTITFLFCALFAVFFSALRTRATPSALEQRFGVTFSPRTVALYGPEDPVEEFTAILDDLGARVIRIPVYWDLVEPRAGEYDFSSVDPYMALAAARGAHVTLAIGMKVPRWPECFVPGWVTGDTRRAALFAYVQAVVARYKDHPALARWQVENEAHFSFGMCPASDSTFLADEVALVRAADPATPIELTVSGEQELWGDTAEMADVIGTSLYRFAWNPVTGIVVFPHPPEFYRLQARAVSMVVDDVVISELQAEPWFADGVIPEDTQARYALFTVDRLAEHAAYAERTGIPEVSFWGVEWWYSLAMRGDTRLWEAAKTYFD